MLWPYPLSPFLLLLFLSVSLPLSSLTCIDIRVSDRGIDAKNCTNGTPGAVCRSLSYALKNLLSDDCAKVYIDNDTIMSEPVNVCSIAGLEIHGNLSRTKVDCEFGAGVSFEDVDDIVISNIFWNNCSVGSNFVVTPSYNVTLRSALYFHSSGNISISECRFTSNHGSGIIMENMEGMVQVTDSFFVNHSLLVPCNESLLNESCYNQSVGISIYSTNISGSEYYIEHCLFEGNDNLLPANLTRNESIIDHKEYRTLSHGGGLQIRLTGNSSYNSFIIQDCNFTENQALWGGGMEVGVGDDSAWNVVNVTRTNFARNYGLNGGGLRFGIFPPLGYTGFGAEEMDNVFIVSDCTFSDNNAQSSAGISYIANKQIVQTNISHIAISHSNFTNNVANISGAAIGLTAWNNEIGGYPTIAAIDNCVFDNNSIYIEVDHSQVYGTGVVYTESIVLNITDSTFIRNLGSALDVSSTTVFMGGEVAFIDNFGVHGGAIHLIGLAWITMRHGLNLTFENNRAFLSGGGIFSAYSSPHPQKDIRFCIFKYEDPVADISQWNVSVYFIGNTAEISGPSIFFSTPGGCSVLFSNDHNVIFHNLTNTCNTPPHSFEFGAPAKCVNGSYVTDVAPAKCVNGSYVTDVMLGQPFKIYPQTVDVFGQKTMGSTILQIYCKTDGVTCNKSSDTVYSIVGQELVQLTNTPEHTSFYIAGPKSTKQDTYILFYSYDFPSTVGYLHLNITPCQLGYHYNPATNTCHCYWSDNVFCSTEQACIKYGYWIGNVHGKVSISHCPGGNCGYSDAQCPTNECGDSFKTFCELPETDSDQLCSNNRGGILCSSCKPGYTFSFAAVHCVPESKCSAGDTALLLVLHVVFWAVLIVILFIVLKLHLRIGSGQLYCLFYYFGVLKYLTSNGLPSEFLTVIVSVFGGFLELDPRFLGLIDKCFSSKFNNIFHQMLRYVNPLFVTAVVLVVIGATRLFPRLSTISKQNYGVRALCILFYVSFTSLSETSLQILNFIKFEGVPGVFVRIEPDIRYFDPVHHLPYALVALFIEIFFVLPFLFVMLFAPWLARVRWINLTRIKPIIDEYQGCYKDQYRWFAGYYLLCRQFVFLFSLVDLGEFGSIFFLQQLSIVVLVVHAAFSPYKKTWLNILDIILLGDLAIYSLFNGSTANVVLGNSLAFRNALVHILVLIPFIYFLGICCLKLMMRIYIYYKGRDAPFTLSMSFRRNRYKSPTVLYEPSSRTYPGTMEREPLIFDCDEEQHTLYTEPHMVVSSILAPTDPESDQHSVSSASEPETPPPTLTWYSRLSQGFRTRRTQQTSKALGQELESTIASIGKDVRQSAHYTTSVVTTSTKEN